jgi:peroxiredoxin
MSTQNPELTDSRTGNRNPVILIGGLAVLLIAFAALIFGGALFGDNATSLPETTIQQAQTNEVVLPTSGPPLQVGDTPYEFTLQGVDGETIALSQFIGRPILVNYWATWCGPCRIEMPEIQAIWEEHQADGLVVLALDQSESAEDVQAYFDELGLTFTPVLDEDNRTSQNYGLQGTLPSSVFINPAGEITAIHRGVMTRGQLDGYLAETLGTEAQS